MSEILQDVDPFPDQLLWVPDFLCNRFDIRYGMLHGSVVRGRDEYNDVDVFLIVDDEFDQTFETIQQNETTLDIELSSERNLRSYIDHYYWYPENLIGEIGKFRYGRSFVYDESIEQVVSSVASPTPTVRWFILSHHLGQLLLAEADASSCDWNNLWVNVPWSVICVTSAVFDTYPESVYTSEFIDQVSEEHAELLTPIADNSAFSSSILTDLQELAEPRVNDWIDEITRDGTIPVHYRAQREAAVWLQDQTSSLPSQLSVEYEER